MSEILPEREGLRRAVSWIAECRKDDPAANLPKLVDEASRRFDLTPLDEEYLWQLLVARK